MIKQKDDKYQWKILQNFYMLKLKIIMKEEILMMKSKQFLEMKNKLKMAKKKELVILNILIKSQKELQK